MTPPETQNNQHGRRLGEIIRRERVGRFTLQELAKAADLSVGSLSQIERGLGNPSFNTLTKIAGALGLRIGDLVEAGAETQHKSDSLVVRADDRSRLQIGSEGLVYELLTPNLRGKLEVLETTVPPGFSNQANPFTHVGEECVVVLEGDLRVVVGKETNHLQSGDAITYDSALPHWWENETTRDAKLIGAVTPPSF